MAASGEVTEQEVKNNIKSLITSNPIVSTIQSIQKDYRDFLGTPIPFHKFGYNSVEHFLKSIPDTCVVQGTGPFAQVTPIISEKSAHINEMVIQQKVNTKGKRKCLNPRRRNFNTMRNDMPTFRRPPSWNTIRNYSFSPNTVFSSSSSLGHSSSDSRAKNIPNIVRTNNPNGNMGVKNTNLQKNNTGIKSATYQMVRGGLRTENTEAKRNYILEQNKFQSGKVKEQLDSFIQKKVKLGNVSKNTITSPPKNQETEELNNSKIFHMPENAPILDKVTLWNLDNNKYDTTQELPKETSDDTEDSLFTKSKQRLNNLLYNFKSMEEELEEDTSNVPKRVQVNLRTLISQFIDGIWVSDLPDHYKRLFKKDLMYMEYGYTSLIEMCIALKNIFHYVRPGRDDFKLYDRSKSLPESVEKLYTMASYDVGEKVVSTEALPDLEWCDFKGYIPDKVFKYGNEIPSEFLPRDTKVDTILDVVVVEIYDPSKFWFYLGTSENNTPLDDLMDKMQSFYNQPGNAKEYAVPLGAVREGLYCVHVIYGEYHRARIVRVLSDGTDYVRVFYIDYGTVCKVPIKGMCFLHTDFAELSAQALRCRLANIVPNLKGHPWPRTTSDRFRELVNRRDTKIKISHINWDEEYVCVFLADVTDPGNVLYINETLVKEGHALWDKEIQVVPFVLSNFKCKVQNLHLFPTFVELEYGLAPNASEMYSLEEILAPLQFCLPNYFEPNEELLSSDDEFEIEQLENSFIETVKNHRKFTPLNKVDVNTVINPPPIDFDIFGDLKEEIVEFWNSTIKDKDPKQEEDLSCYVEEAAGENLEHFKDIERSLEEFEPIRLIKQEKELSESIIEKLEKYSLLGSEHSSGSDCEGSVKSHSLASSQKSDFFDLDLQEQLLSPQEIKDNDLSTIFEQSEIELDTSEPESLKDAFVGFNLIAAPLSSDTNIFDNPEEFDGISDNSENNENSRPISPESFLRNVEKICRRDLEEESDVLEPLEEYNSTTDNSLAVCPNKENPIDFYTEPDLLEAFKSFLRAQKKSSGNAVSDSSCEQSPNLSSQYVEPECSENNSICAASFLKCDSQSKGLEEVLEVGERNKEDLEKKEISKVDKNDVVYKINLEETRSKSFVSTLSLNNPFRNFLEVASGDSTDYLSTVGTENENKKVTEKTTLASSESTDSFRRNLLDTDIKRKNLESEAPSTKTTDSEGSDYKVFIPKSRQNQASSMPNQEDIRAWVQNSTGPIGMDTPPRVGTPNSVATPPRIFTPPGYVPVGYPPYPQWSNGSGYPVPQYHQWSNGGYYPPCPPNFSQPREMLRPPPGFSYQGPPRNFNGPPQNFNGPPQNFNGPPQNFNGPPQNFNGPPQNFNPYMASRMVPVAPVYQPSGQGYYPPPPRQLVPSLTEERDFYERYNESLMKQSKGPSS